MRIVLSGICGFVGITLAKAIQAATLPWDVVGIDNLSRPGSELNRVRLRELGIRLYHGDLRSQSDVDTLPKADWIIDCAANPSVLAGKSEAATSRQLLEHNLMGTVNLLEKCRSDMAGFVLISTSRVYSIKPLSGLEVRVRNGAFEPVIGHDTPLGLTSLGIGETFSTEPSQSLYGASKRASEILALEYGAAFEFPVWINRCGVLAGGGQFGKPDQGILSFWIHSHFRRKPLCYLGFDGMGHQVRDCLHPRDLLPLLQRQIEEPTSSAKPRVINVSGGIDSAFSLRNLTCWCDGRFGAHPVESDRRPRLFDLPWIVLDSSLAKAVWGWEPETTVDEILDEIATFAQAHPDWLELSAAQ